MTRPISAANLAVINSEYAHIVTMVHMAFDEPVFVHTGFGRIVFDGNTYLGVGGLGDIDVLRESELLGPTQISFSLSHVDPNLLAEAKDAGRFKDEITIYEGYRLDTGALVDDPIILWKGTFEYASIKMDSTGSVVVIAQSDLAVLEQKDGGRFSDEDQQRRFSGDLGLEFVADSSTKTLLWGGRPVGQGGGGGLRPFGGENFQRR